MNDKKFIVVVLASLTALAVLVIIIYGISHA